MAPARSRWLFTWIVSVWILAITALLAERSVEAGINQWTMIGPAGQSVSALVIDPTNTSILYAGTDQDVFKSVDGGASWQTAGLVGTVRILTIAPRTPTIIYAVGAGALYKSIDGGTRWTSVAQLPTNSIQALAIDPLTPETLYAGYGEIRQELRAFGCCTEVVAGGVLKSTDGGVTWTDLSLVKTPVDVLVFDPARPTILYAHFSIPSGTSSGPGNRGVLQSLDGGATWNAVFPNDPFAQIAPERALDPNNPSTAYWDYSDYGRVDSSVLRSTDSGKNWGSLRPLDKACSVGTVYITALVIVRDGSRLYARAICVVDGQFSGNERVFVVDTRTLLPEVMITLENPTDDQPVSGIAVVRGWVFPTRSAVQIGEITYSAEYFVTLHPSCCSERTDVQHAFPQFPTGTTLNSGWGVTVNWGELPPGERNIHVWIYDTDGRLLALMNRTVTVVKAADYLRFLDQFALTEADVTIVGDELIVNKVSVIKSAASPTFINVRFRWFTNSQSLGMVHAELVSRQSASQSVRWSFLASVKDWLWSKLSIGAQVYAEIGIHSFFESPVEGQNASGISIVRGWAFTDSALTPVREIRLLIDGKPAGTIPCCSERDDVFQAFNLPGNFREDIWKSGWGTQLNYGDLTPSAHTLMIQIQASDLTTQTLTRPIQTLRLGGFVFIDQFDLTVATARIDGEEIVLK